MRANPDPPSSRPPEAPSMPLGTTREPEPVAFGLSFELLLMALLPLWLFLASLLPVLAAIWLGVIGGEMFYSATLATGFLCYAVLLPLGAYGFHLAGERRRGIADEKLSHFSSRIVELYTAASRSPELAEDPQTSQAFRLYLLAGEELYKNPRKPREETWSMISRGTSLVDRLLRSRH